MILPGSQVRLRTPSNPRLDGAIATVEALWTWGAHVLCAAAGSGRFRALHSEMEEVGDNGVNGYARAGVAVPVRAQTPVPATLRDGATGEICVKCGGLNMFRAGACLCCADCGESSGCS